MMVFDPEPTVLTPEWWAETREAAQLSRADWRRWMANDLKCGRSASAWDAYRAIVTQASIMSTCEQYDGHVDRHLLDSTC